MKRLNVLIGLMFMLLTADAQKFVWYGANGVSQVETGLGNVTGTHGIWFSYADDADGGASYVVWDSEMVDEIVTTPKYTGGVSGTAVLDKGFLGYSPFAGVGFNIVGEAPRSSSDEWPPLLSADVSGWGGLCISYMSDADMYVELGLGDMDAEIAYANPYCTLPSSATGNTVRIPWSDFKQPSWYENETKMPGEEAAKKLVCVKFKIQNEDGSYHFNIYGVGSLNADAATPPPSKVTTGDANGDGDVTMADANMVVNYFLSTNKSSTKGFNFRNANMNGDDDITMADANQIVSMYLNSK